MTDTLITVPAVPAVLKFTAAQVEGDCPEILCDLGKKIAAHMKSARKSEEKAEQHRISAGLLLEIAIDSCDETGFDAFLKKFCPDLGRSRVYELKAIAAGKKSFEDTRASTRERVARHRAKTSPLQPVTDSAAPTSEGAGDDHAETSTSAIEEFHESPLAPAEPVGPTPTPTTQTEPHRASSKSKTKPSLAEFWEASEEDRAAIRDLVLEEHYAKADGRNLFSRIRGANRDDVIRDFLDALGVKGMQAVVSPEFKTDLCTKLRTDLRAELCVELRAELPANHAVSACWSGKTPAPSRGRSSRRLAGLRPTPFAQACHRNPLS